MSNDRVVGIIVGAILATWIATLGVVVPLNAGLRDDLAGLRAEMTGRLDRLEQRLDGFDDRLRAVEIAFGRVDQRLLTIERVVLPADPGN